MLIAISSLTNPLDITSLGSWIVSGLQAALSFSLGAIVFVTAIMLAIAFIQFMLQRF